MRILVTGGAGFVGTNLVKRLLNEGHKVFSLDNYTTGLESNHISGCRYIVGDVNSINAIGELIDNTSIDIVFHLAAKARIQPSFDIPEEYIKSNYQGTYEVVKYCVKRNIPLIYAGSSSHHSGKLSNPYTYSKTMGEEVIQLYQQHFGLRASITRFYNVYGPHQLTEGGYTTLIGRWLNNIKNGIQCEIYGDGSKRRDFTHVDDIVDALVKIVDTESYGYIFELGREENHSVLDVSKMFNIDPIFKDNKPGEALITLADGAEARLVLQWSANINLEEYIKEML